MGRATTKDNDTNGTQDLRINGILQVAERKGLYAWLRLPLSNCLKPGCTSAIKRVGGVPRGRGE